MENNINDQPERYFLKKSTDEEKESLCDNLEDDCSHPIRRICDLCFERHNIRSEDPLQRVDIYFHCTLKILRPISERRNVPQNILAWKENAMNFLRIAAGRHKDFFVDETGFRKLTGIRATRVVLASRSLNYSVACTMSYEGMVNFKISERWKGLVRQANSKSADELFSAVETFSTHVTSNDGIGFDRHMESYLPGCIPGYPFEN
ncbi:hypothetical protein RF11_12060 [Thelohanellus kitauei]|uniref:Uncharacterized protein n=1 Tax=Thelohanellus kitauei TaxID=669202 RepID=A0A0C2MX85_THEKT|nr:hypothetical protein RF11_12060 [Thelohanellus kitauei]